MDKLKSFITQSFGAVSKYFISKLISGTIIALAGGLILKYFGIQSPFLIGIVMGIGNLIPIFGVWCGIIIGCIISLAQNINQPIYALYIIGVGVFLQIIDEFITTPLVVGKAVDIKPLVIILAVYIGGFLFGFWGIVFAVPAALIIKIAYSVFLSKNNNADNQKPD